MQMIREYVTGLAAAAMICAIVLCFAGKGKTEPLLKLICGLVLTFAMIDPILHISGGDWESLGIDFAGDAEIAAEEGKDQAEKTVRQLIKEETEAYILDKAQSLDLNIQVSVGLSDQPMPVPVQVTIRGQVSPYKRSQLSRILTEELGIAKEMQQWIS